MIVAPKIMEGDQVFRFVWRNRGSDGNGRGASGYFQSASAIEAPTIMEGDQEGIFVWPVR